jgi:hypothetical protein
MWGFPPWEGQGISTRLRLRTRLDTDLIDAAGQFAGKLSPPVGRQLPPLPDLRDRAATAPAPARPPVESTLGPKVADGSDTYVLCEINASSVFPIPEEAPDALAATTLQRLGPAGNRH